jgi:LmbE family N-acetylglucosaminyl deacetylase
MPPYTFLIDISNQFKDKLRAIKCYRSQFVDNPTKQSMFEYVKNLNNYLGKLIRTQYAEAIYSTEAIKIEDITCLL